ncbi:MAG: MBL fold metallo-hydrolase, partial [Erysipelotrichaceae bacterium]|nr:MBL fold metallo-hydrolase [Erysipelotrichaceae bacterium]
MQITINCHSSIRVATDKIIYFDPFKIEEETHDADIIFITHDHFDHFSVEDIKKVEKEDTVYVIPDCMYNLLGGENVVTVNPGEKNIVEGY